MRAGHVTIPNGLGPGGATEAVRVAPNELPLKEDRDWFAGTPHKHVRASIEAMAEEASTRHEPTRRSMMTDAWQVVPAGDGTLFAWANDVVRVKTPAPFTGGAVSVVEDTLKPGFRLTRHHHKQMTEVFYVLDGDVRFVFDDRTVDATSGMTVNVAPGVHHEVVSPGGGRLITIFIPGGFDFYLAEVAELVAQGRDDEATLTALGQRYDIWPDD